MDITPDEFYERLKTASVMPTTSQASVAGFREAFEALVARKVPVLALVVSGKLSGTLQSADNLRSPIPWSNVPGAAKPYRVTPAGAAKFYRVTR